MGKVEEFYGGNIFMIAGEKYMLAMITVKRLVTWGFQLIGLKSGNRYSDCIIINSRFFVNKEELAKLCEAEAKEVESIMATAQCAA